MYKTAFDNDKYLKIQKEAILDRIAKFENKLYLEFGGKLFNDYHAARVLPGYDPNVKIKLLHSLKNKLDIILCINANAIENKKIVSDLGISYDTNIFKMIDDLHRWDMNLNAIVITRFNGQAGATTFKSKLERRGIKVYTHKPIEGYPNDFKKILSKSGFGANKYIKTKKPLVIITAPGPGSGKLATCLSQIYHDHEKRTYSGYAKFETFPVWNLPLKHPVNIAYEASTADLNDINMIDTFHMKNYHKKAVNYNRDLEAFPLISKILKMIMHEKFIYNSPTDMGVNMIGFCITDNQVTKEASKQELIRRYFRYNCEYIMGICSKSTLNRMNFLLKELEVKIEDRKTVGYAKEAASEAEKKNKGNEGIYSGAAIELKTGKIVTGKNSKLMHAASSLILNTIKELAGIPDEIDLLSPQIIESIEKYKKEIYGSSSLSLDLEETLIALSICAASDQRVKKALTKLKELKGCEVHLTHMPTPGDSAGLRKLGVNLTSEPNFASKNFFIE